MSSTTTSRNIFLSLLLSIILTFILAIIYAFSPISAILASLLSRRDGTGGIGAVAGGLSESFLLVLLVAGPVLFLIIFSLLQRRHVKS